MIVMHTIPIVLLLVMIWAKRVHIDILEISNIFDLMEMSE